MDRNHQPQADGCQGRRQGCFDNNIIPVSVKYGNQNPGRAGKFCLLALPPFYCWRAPRPSCEDPGACQLGGKMGILPGQT